MSLREKLAADVKNAMKAREAGKLKLKVLRMVMAAVKNREIEVKNELSDDEIIDVIVKEVKMRQESLTAFEKAGRTDQAEELRQEIAILTGYLPEQMDETEIRRLVEEVIAGTGAKSSKDMGRVMGALMPKVKGRADGKVVNKIARELLS